MSCNFEYIKNEDGEIIGSYSRSINDKKHELWEAVTDAKGQIHFVIMERYDTFLEAKKAMKELIKRSILNKGDS